MVEQSVGTPDGIRLRTVTTGSGQPLVLCHGGPGLWDYLEPLAVLIDGVLRVHRYDQRGCGLSTGDGPYTVSQFVFDLDTLRGAFGHETWWVGGHSWGAELALHYAATYPDRVRGLVYICGTGIGDAFREPYRTERRRRLGCDLTRWEHLRDKAIRTAAEEREFCILQWRPDYAPTSDAASLAEAMWDARFRVNMRCNRELAADPARDESHLTARCTELTVPVLIIHGAQDPRPMWSTDSLLRELPRVRRTVIDNAGHLPWTEQPATVTNAVLEFLRATPQT